MRTLAPLFAAAITAVLVVAVFQVHSRLTTEVAGPSAVVTVGPEPTPLATVRRTAEPSRSGHGSGHHHCTADDWRSRLKPAERWIDQQESHLNPLAVEPSTHAYGIGQLLPSTYTALGLPMSPDPCDQIKAQRAYLQRHYGGSWAAALRHKKETGWW